MVNKELCKGGKIMLSKMEPTLLGGKNEEE